MISTKFFRRPDGTTRTGLKTPWCVWKLAQTLFWCLILVLCFGPVPVNSGTLNTTIIYVTSANGVPSNPCVVNTLYVQLDATNSQYVWVCIGLVGSAGTWANAGGGGGGGGSSNGVATVTSGVMAITAMPGSTQPVGTSSIGGPCTSITPSGSTTENAYVYWTSNGVHIKAATNTFAVVGTNCTADSPSGGSNPVGTFLMYTWHMTSGAFDASATTSWITQAVQVALSCSTGLVCTNGGATIAIDTAIVQQFAGVSTQSGTSYAVQDSDRNKLLVFTNAGAVAVSIAQAGGSGLFVNGWQVDLLCLGCGGITLTPATSTINNVSTLSVAASVWAHVRSTGSNYYGATTNGATGPIGPTGPISGMTGDGTVFNSSVSITGGNTLAPSLHTQSANQGLYGPTGGSAAAPTFRTQVLADLPAITALHLYGGAASTGAAADITPQQQLISDGTNLNVNMLDTRYVTFTDDLISGGNSNGTWGQLGWSCTGTSGGTTANLTPAVWPNLGILKLTTNNGAGGDNWNCSSTVAGAAVLGSLAANANWDSKVIVALGATTNIKMFVGFASACANLPVNGFGIRFDTTQSDTNFVPESVVSSTATAGSAFTGTINTSYHTLRVRAPTAGQVNMSIDAGAETSFCPSTCTVTATPSVANVQPCISIASGSTNAAQVLNFDFYGFQAKVSATAERQ